MGATDRARLFSRWLGLLSIEKKEDIAKKLWKENYASKLLSNTYNKKTLEEEISDFKTVNESNRKSLLDLQNELNAANENILKYNKDKTEVLSSIKPIKDGLDTIDVTTVKNEIERYSTELANKRAVFQSHKKEYADYKNASFNQDDLDKAKQKKEKLEKEVKDYELQNSEIKGQINAIKEDTKRINDLLEKGICPTCGQNIDIVEQQKAINENDGKIQKLIEKGVYRKTQIDSLKTQIKTCEDTIDKLEGDKEKTTKNANLELKMVAVKSNIDTLKLNIEKDTAKLEEIKTNEENIKHNNEIRLKANAIEVSIGNETKIKETKIKDIENANHCIEDNEKQIKLREDLIGKLAAEERVIRNWNLYLELVGKNGIVKLVLKDALPIINNEVSRIINGLCDFDVKLDIDDKNNVVMNLMKDGVALDLGVAASGFEGTVASLALRSTLASISSLSRPNFLVLDEILSGDAACNCDNIHELYKRILSNYDFILNITHNELIYDWHEGGVITVVKENNISKLKQM
jgi:exonuclease SbcC